MKRLTTLLAVDGRRMFRSGWFWVLMGACLVMPILILVMTTLLDGSVTVNPQTGAETVLEGFDNVWQIIGSTSNHAMSSEMSMTAMCNLNLLYFLFPALVCVFVAQDFRSGFAKNIFAIRAGASGYVASKSIVCSLSAMAMLLAFVLGSLLGGVLAGLPFEMVGFTGGQLALCILCKLLLAPVFVALDLCMSVIAKDKAWLSILLAVMAGMFLFMMIGMLTPLDAGVAQVGLCLAGSVLFSVGLGAVSRLLLTKRDLL